MFPVLKKIGLPAVALLVVLIAFSAPANAGVRFGVTVGAPVYTYPYYSSYSYPYPVYNHYYYSAYPYYSYPVYPRYRYTYVYPRHVRVHRHIRHEWRRW
jgi:hypothetical protein